MNADEMYACFKEAGVPPMVPIWLARELATGLGITPWLDHKRAVDAASLSRDFARRLRDQERTAK